MILATKLKCKQIFFILAIILFFISIPISKTLAASTDSPFIVTSQVENLEQDELTGFISFDYYVIIEGQAIQNNYNYVLDYTLRLPTPYTTVQVETNQLVSADEYLAPPGSICGFINPSFSGWYDFAQLYQLTGERGLVKFHFDNFDPDKLSVIAPSFIDFTLKLTAGTNPPL